MKKLISLIIILSMVFAISVFPAHAAEGETVTYVPTCPLCGARLSARSQNYPDDLRTVESCEEDAESHMHYNIYFVRNWECHTVDCDLIGYVVYQDGPVLIEEDCCNSKDAIV